MVFVLLGENIFTTKIMDWSICYFTVSPHVFFDSAKGLQCVGGGGQGANVHGGCYSRTRGGGAIDCVLQYNHTCSDCCNFLESSSQIVQQARSATYLCFQTYS